MSAMMETIEATINILYYTIYYELHYSIIYYDMLQCSARALNP